MAQHTSSKSADGKGVPAAGEQQTAETETRDDRLFPGGSPEAADTPVGMSGLDKDVTAPDDRVLPGVKSVS